MKKRCLIVVLVVASFSSNAAELSEGKKYRATTSLAVSGDGATYDLNVGAQSKFLVLGADDGTYAITFLNIYPYSTIKPAGSRTVTSYKTKSASDVVEGEVYFLKKGSDSGLSIESKVSQAFGGAVSGPLLVPFKYRLDDKSLDGSASVGYYAGWGIDTNFFGASEAYVTFTPFLAAGLTQISFEEIAADGSRKSETKSGISWAAGILIRNWDSLNIGFVYGEDRIGDQEFTHEGKGWLSFSVGWEL